ncbi:MAG: glutamyl-tRNA reductase [Nitrososphaerota archaeon]|nr:glutamyl-tRNA reductase [Nitrososphaerota archaeon]
MDSTNDSSEHSAITVAVIGATFKTAPIATRENLTRKITLEKLEKLKKDENLRDCEFAILSTCNRMEIYFACKAIERVSASLLSLLKETGQSREFEMFSFRERDAVEHLFSVSAGLDSLVKGEAQIVSQVHDALAQAKQYSLAGPVLSLVFQRAVAAGREVRIANPSYANEARNSMSFSIAKFLERGLSSKDDDLSQIGGPFKPNILVLGSGKMAKLAVKSLDRQKVGKILLASRRLPTNDIGADANISLEEVAPELRKNTVAVIISAISSDGYVLHPEHLSFHETEKESASNRRKPLLIVDMSFPRSVDPAVRDMRNVTLYDLDDLARKDVLREAIESPNQSSYLSHAEELVRRRSYECLQAIKEEDSGVNDILSRLYNAAEDIRSDEVNAALERMPDLSASDQKILEVMSQRMVRRILRLPTERLRIIARNESNEVSSVYLETIQELFSLKD